MPRMSKKKKGSGDLDANASAKYTLGELETLSVGHPVFAEWVRGVSVVAATALLHEVSRRGSRGGAEVILVFHSTDPLENPTRVRMTSDDKRLIVKACKAIGTTPARFLRYVPLAVHARTVEKDGEHPLLSQLFAAKKVGSDLGRGAKVEAV